LRRNRPHWLQVNQNDVSDFCRVGYPANFGLVPGELALLAAAPPCQPFSAAAQWSASARTGLDDSRARCVKSLMKVVSSFLPEVVVLENVAGFVEGRSSALPYLTRAFAAINGHRSTSYRVQTRVLDAADYGVPQRRRRAFVVAHREGRTFEWPRVIRQRSTCWDALHDVAIADPPRPLGKWAELLPSIPEGHNYLWHTRRGGGEPLFGYRSRYWSFLLKLSKDQPSWTLAAQPGPSTGPFHWDNRPLAVPEMLRLQSFPTDWIVAGSRRSQVRQVGNATPPLLAEAVGREVAAQFFDAELPEEWQLRLARAQSAPSVPAKPGPVAPKYRPLLGDHPDHPGRGKGPQPHTPAAAVA
jgi:DNA (cytosine-5)-methyltransferase 1